MGNRCVIGFQNKEEIKATYSHWGSHPSRLGKQITLLLSKLPQHYYDKLKNSAEKITWVSLDSQPAPEEIEKYKHFADKTVSTRKLTDWYCLLHKTQGVNSLLFLIDGSLNHFIDSTYYLKDSLFCEWAYIINFDNETLDVYEGNQTRPDSNNPLGQKIAHAINGENYYPMKCIKRVNLYEPLSDLTWNAMMELEETEQNKRSTE